MSAFWETKTLEEMSDEEWESLCDGCARCCMIKLQDDETEEVHYTALVCDLLDQDTCQCTAYPKRHELVANCVVLSERGNSIGCQNRVPIERLPKVASSTGGTPW